VVDRPVGLAHELGHEVEVADLGEEVGDVTEGLVGVDLLQGCLSEPGRVLGVVLVRAVEHETPLVPHLLLPDDRRLASLAAELEAITPQHGVLVGPDADIDGNVRPLARRQAAKAGDSPAPVDRCLEAADDGRDVMQEAQRVEQVALAHGVRPDQEGSALQLHIDREEVAPVTETKHG